MSIKIIARPRPGTDEPDLLAGREFHALHIIDHDGGTVWVVQPPENGWDHGTLEAEGDKFSVGEAHLVAVSGGLGFWIGSSEI